MKTIERVPSAEVLLAAIVQSSEDAIISKDLDGIITSWNAGAQRLFGYTADETIGRHISILAAPGRENEMMHILERIRRGERVEHFDTVRRRKDGSTLDISLTVSPIRNAEGEIIGASKIARDITERRLAHEALQLSETRLRSTLDALAALNAELEKRVAERTAQLRQAQKMEAVGQLTGGIAHDFNNLLTVIIGGLDIIQRRLATAAPESTAAELAPVLQRPISSAMQGARIAAQLTHRLLAVSRRQPLEPKTLDVNKLVSGLSDMIRRTLGETIDVETVAGGGLWLTCADAHQLENVILNLVVNARDAMPHGGKLTIETANTYLDDAYTSALEDVLPGQYVMLSVSDSGTGMPPDVLERAFEPFFTTKEVGTGSGLGLSTVYGFVKQSGGHIRLYSELGEGTTVKIYLPRAAGAQAEQTRAPVTARDDSTLPRACAGETVLLVEDNEEVRQHGVTVMEELGYCVLEASDAASALRILAANPDQRIDLLFTDVVLPGGVGGLMLAEQLIIIRPEVKVLFASGYTRNAIVHQGRLDPEVHILLKPFDLESLARKIRDVLDLPRRPAKPADAVGE